LPGRRTGVGGTAVEDGGGAVPVPVPAVGALFLSTSSLGLRAGDGLVVDVAEGAGVVVAVVVGAAVAVAVPAGVVGPWRPATVPTGVAVAVPVAAAVVVVVGAAVATGIAAPGVVVVAAGVVAAGVVAPVLDGWWTVPGPVRLGPEVWEGMLEGLLSVVTTQPTAITEPSIRASKQDFMGISLGTVVGEASQVRALRR
jgi:hypothetical protein